MDVRDRMAEERADIAGPRVDSYDDLAGAERPGGFHQDAIQSGYC